MLRQPHSPETNRGYRPADSIAGSEPGLAAAETRKNSCAASQNVA